MFIYLFFFCISKKNPVSIRASSGSRGGPVLYRGFYGKGEKRKARGLTTHVWIDLSSSSVCVLPKVLLKEDRTTRNTIALDTQT